MASTMASSWHGWCLTYIFPPLFLSWRLFWANRLPIMDCDETYNYWEPLYYLTTTTNHDNDMNNTLEPWRGMQTWEYAHEYALRTFAYLWPLKFVGQGLMSLTQALGLAPSLVEQWLALESTADSFESSSPSSSNPKLLQFLLLREALGAAMALAELFWLVSLKQHLGPRVALWTGLLLLTGAGANHAAAAFLPSATWGMVYLVAAGLLLRGQHSAFCAVAVTATLAIGWPFGVVTCGPMGVLILWREWNNDNNKGSGIVNVVKLLTFTAVVTILVQAVVMYVDQQQYGRWTSATLNIFNYNAAGGGDELYGVEPVSYYIKNLLLNWNLVAPIGIAGVLPVTLFSSSQKKQQRGDDHNNKQTILAMLVAPLYLWLAITVPRPHKEERFLFPIYPMICLAAVQTVDTTINWMGRVLASLSRHKEMPAKYRDGMHATVWSVAMTLGLLRTMALHKYYTAPLAIYSQLGRVVQQQRQPTDSRQLVCTCGEWYRFPGSYFLPNDNIGLGFLPSGFDGQLPQPFTEWGSRPESVAQLQPFNDQNQGLPERFVDSRANCQWIVDLEDNEECFPKKENDNEIDYKILARRPFLNADQTTSTLHRILYIPYLHEKAVEAGSVKYHNYVLAEVMPRSS